METSTNEDPASIIDISKFESSVIETLNQILKDLVDIKTGSNNDSAEPRYVIHAIATRMDEFSSVLKHLHATKLHEKVNVVIAKVERLTATVAYLCHSMQTLLDEHDHIKQVDNSLIEVKKSLVIMTDKQDQILDMLLTFTNQSKSKEEEDDDDDDDEYHTNIMAKNERANSLFSSLILPMSHSDLRQNIPGMSWVFSAPINQEHHVHFQQQQQPSEETQHALQSTPSETTTISEIS